LALLAVAVLLLGQLVLPRKLLLLLLLLWRAWEVFLMLRRHQT
jgi:hypothetical protein